MQITLAQGVEYLVREGYLDSTVPLPTLVNRAKTWRKRGLFPAPDDTQLGHPLWLRSTLLRWANQGGVPAPSRPGR